MTQPSLPMWRPVAAGLALTLASVLPKAGHTSPNPPAAKKRPAWTQPKAPWGDSDLQGMWPSGEMTGVPLQRPEHVGERAAVTGEEFAERQAQLVRSQQ